MSVRLSAAVICLGIVAVACGATEPSAASGDKLYMAVSGISSQFVQVIDSRSHKVERRLPMGVPSSDWKHLYSIVSTSLVDSDPQTGATLATLQLGGTYGFLTQARPAYLVGSRQTALGSWSSLMTRPTAISRPQRISSSSRHLP